MLRHRISKKCFGIIDVMPRHVTAGNIGNVLFVAIDGRMALEVRDPDPIDLMKHGKVGFEAYCTRVKYKNLCIRRMEAENSFEPYKPEF